MKIKFASDNIFVRAVVNGHPGWMMVDTGCSSTSLDKGFCRRAGLSSTGYCHGYDATSGLGKMPLASVPRIKAGSIHLKDMQCAIIDYGPLQRALKIEFIGILGAELFQNRLILLDVGRRRLASIKAVPRSFVHRVPISRFVNGIPLVKIMAGRIKISAMVDTGNAKIPFIVYSPRIVERLRCKFSSKGRTRHWGVSGKDKTTATVIGCPVGFAGLALPETRVVCQDPGSGSILGARIQGNIGLPLLRGYQIVFDYQNKFLYLKP